ncbi:sporulation histidine kinase inhibitor Sda [Paenibacillus sacheonensis]|uniref:Sporulation histidine kinase inhibitor Sda n=1 Tax=Paenibacillus sacheonensis TaxID=742054 RepID=A0A7X4YNW5_9BACL|nr:sporulation histidine kinase inhibitor Sda [Paenibacillus sacheonensis]MBM7567440.1 developmental checkpoint coupling sporulation initiation to replication initiation [Paenibacillus sacheonensis]NBC69777.1 sporulation histidine kinase inhibitor Sda [Paenibacillus sacheonensis]
MEQLSDELLLDAYIAANKYNLEPEFIEMLEVELLRRQISPDAYRNTA